VEHRCKPRRVTPGVIDPLSHSSMPGLTKCWHPLRWPMASVAFSLRRGRRHDFLASLAEQGERNNHVIIGKSTQRSSLGINQLTSGARRYATKTGNGYVTYQLPSQIWAVLPTRLVHWLGSCSMMIHRMTGMG
jgi:hypothetical protein